MPRPSAEHSEPHHRAGRAQVVHGAAASGRQQHSREPGAVPRTAVIRPCGATRAADLSRGNGQDVIRMHGHLPCATPKGLRICGED
ncbi:hypothetical protein ACFRCI_09950 [Streptomyces sp. NPDC056638]|uniref:hypothetical protein n=1 Tax=Streptomyces sp. NPDC056638 TaxID=3345887 RepID=UPI0036C71539